MGSSNTFILVDGMPANARTTYVVMSNAFRADYRILVVGMTYFEIQFADILLHYMLIHLHNNVTNVVLITKTVYASTVSR